MRWIVAISLAFLGGFAVMVLEIVGARYLARFFGSSLYVWTSQIGIVLVALTIGYLIGGSLADRRPRLHLLSGLLMAGALFTALIPQLAPPLMEALISRHPAELPIPALWQRLDPALGSALVFLPPCFVLATLPPFLIRHTARRLEQVGRMSGAVYGAGSAGSIAGVFTGGFLLLDLFTLPQVFLGTGLLMFGLALLCLCAESPFLRPSESSHDPP